ncbi:MAG: S41 family peptidase [Candidatus Omnitrophica bacterium]|nr:S41 family peptidase [Candidatus Omnitrophota bacterium]
MKCLRKIIFGSILLLAIASTAIAASGDKTQEGDLYKELELFADAVSFVKSDYAEEVDSKKLMYGAMRGMLASLDDYSEFMDPEEYAELKSETKGEFCGIGIEISMKEGIVTVITPIPGTPAEAAGIKPGDKVVKIDGKITKDMTLDESVKKMRGKPGTIIKLTIWREKDRKILDISIKRATIKIQSIREADFIDGKIGYIKLTDFQDNTIRDLDKTLKKFETSGMDSLILDLRYNPGGTLDSAFDVAERFLAKDKVIVSTKSRVPDQNETFKSSGKHTHAEYPLIVLVNEGSASGSEIVAGAVQDNKRGLILGVRTYGKASVQTVIPMRDGSALRLTTASYLTPSGKMIKGQGITPDVVIEDREDNKKDPDAAEDLFYEKLPAKDRLRKDDQLFAAVGLMKGIKVYNGVK